MHMLQLNLKADASLSMSASMHTGQHVWVSKSQLEVSFMYTSENSENDVCPVMGTVRRETQAKAASFVVMDILKIKMNIPGSSNSNYSICMNEQSLLRLLGHLYL